MSAPRVLCDKYRDHTFYETANMAKSNAQRQAEYRKRAAEALRNQKQQAGEFQKQNRDLPPGWVAVPQRLLAWFDREIERLQRHEQEAAR